MKESADTAIFKKHNIPVFSFSVELPNLIHCSSTAVGMLSYADLVF